MPAAECLSLQCSHISLSTTPRNRAFVSKTAHAQTDDIYSQKCKHLHVICAYLLGRAALRSRSGNTCGRRLPAKPPFGDRMPGPVTCPLALLAAVGRATTAAAVVIVPVSGLAVASA